MTTPIDCIQCKWCLNLGPKVTKSGMCSHFPDTVWHFSFLQGMWKRFIFYPPWRDTDKKCPRRCNLCMNMCTLIIVQAKGLLDDKHFLSFHTPLSQVLVVGTWWNWLCQQVIDDPYYLVRPCGTVFRML